MDPIRILLVDDHPVVREGLRRMLELEEDTEVVGEASSGEEALAQAELLSPNLVLMDVRMPGMGGVEATRQLKRRHPSLNIVVLTMHNDQYLSSAIEAGASGYLLKDMGGEELCRALRMVHQGQSCLHPSLSRELFSEFAAMAKGRAGTQIPLSERQRGMIQLIAQGSTNKEIGAQLFLSETTVKRELHRIFEKLAVNDRAEAISKAYQKGLL